MHRALASALAIPVVAAALATPAVAAPSAGLRVALPDATPCEGCWVPEPGTAWQWQLQGAIDTSVDVAMYDVDGFETSGATVQDLQDAGRAVVCYLSAGSWEDWRPDAHRFPASVLGASNGWPGERWLDIRRLRVLGPIMQARLDVCAAKGFDGVEFDNVDGYRNHTGFPLTGEDQLRYDVYLANQAHRRGLAAFLKNDLGQVRELVPYFDAALNEQCFQYDECNRLRPFVAAGKPVFHVEYRLETADFCADAAELGFDSMRKKLSLRAWREPCP